MFDVRESWTDERLDDFRDEVSRRFDKFEGEVDRRFDAVDHELHRINDRLDGMHKVMLQAIVVMFGSTLTGIIALASLILTQQ
jgi:hypothetical protein